MVCIWVVVNPRAFPPPADMRSWASRSVLGETFWTDRRATPVPARHRLAPFVLTLLSAAGLPFIVVGLVLPDGWVLATGLVLQMTGKLWFLDRMVWLHDDMAAMGHTPPPLRPQSAPTG